MKSEVSVQNLIRKKVSHNRNNIYNNNGGLYVDYGARNIIFNGNVIKNSKEAAFCIGNEDNDINKNFKKCKIK